MQGKVSANKGHEQKSRPVVLKSSHVFISIAVISGIDVANHRVGIVLIVACIHSQVTILARWFQRAIAVSRNCVLAY